MAPSIGVHLEYTPTRRQEGSRESVRFGSDSAFLDTPT